MHQTVVEYQVAPAAMTAVPSASAGQGASGRWFQDILRDEPASPTPEYPALGSAPRGGPPSIWTYVSAAGIAIGLVATWLGLSII